MSSSFHINLFNIVIIVLIILFVGIVILFYVNPKKSLNEFINTTIYNSIPLSNEYKDIVVEYIPPFNYTPNVIMEIMMENAPRNTVKEVCDNIDTKKKFILEQKLRKKKEYDIKLSSDIVKQFSETNNLYPKNFQELENTLYFPIGDEENIDKLNNSFYNIRPWDQILDECKNLYGTVDDINWKAYVYNYRPKIVLY